MPEHYRRNPVIEESPLQRDLMLFDPEKSQFFVLNPTMAFLWKHCDGQTSFDSIIDELPKQFGGVDPQLAATDMKAALHELLSLGLLSGT